MTYASKMSTVYALLLAVLIIGSVQSADVPEKYEYYPCSMREVTGIMYPIYEDCSKYIQCKEAELTIETCPANTHADFAQNKCVTSDKLIMGCKKLTEDKPDK